MTEQTLIKRSAAPRTFPPTPTDGQEHVENGILYRYDAAINAWRRIGPVSTELRYEHAQATAAAVWTIPHNLGFRYLASLVVNSAGNTVIGDVDWPASTSTALRLVFANPVQGTAVVWR